ncbi:MAG: hypothetical protein JSS29_08880 [Proteobacteria bacterium]|nr:hypothetical protein [Pseudomonadota bacterium]
MSVLGKRSALALLVVILIFSAYRLYRYVRYAVAASPQGPAIPGSAGFNLPSGGSLPPDAEGRRQAALGTAALLVGADVMLWLLWHTVRPVRHLPPLVILIVVVLVNLIGLRRLFSQLGAPRT